MEKRFITSGVAERIPVWMQNFLWHLRDTMQVERRDYLQVFALIRSEVAQTIIHTQEEPYYRKVLTVPAADAVTEKIYIIEDPDHVTMLLAEEY